MSSELTRREALKGAAAVAAAATLAPLGALAADVAPMPPPRMCGTRAHDLMYYRMTGEHLDIPDFLRRGEQEMG